VCNLLYTQNMSMEIKTKKDCMGLIQYYLYFIRDGHLKLHLNDDYLPFKSFEDSVKVKKFIKENVANFPLQEMDSQELLGNWISKDGTFEIQIQKNESKGRKYIAVLSKPYKKYSANKGDLKVEFFENYNGELIANYWSFNQAPTSYKVEFDNDKIAIGRSIEFYRDNDKTQKVSDFSLPDSTYFEELTAKTNYLRINSFAYEKSTTIDSLIKENHNKIVSKENLIMDVRNNGGGSDYSYYPLLPYIMDSLYFPSPITASVWVSPDNFNDYDKERYLYGVETKEDSLNADLEIENLKKYIGKFEPSEFGTREIDTLYKNPKNISIIINRRDGSSTELFILTSRQSRKVKTYGENTGGAISYGEWREIKIPNLPAWISMPQKRMRFYDGSDFEMIGIKPDIELNPNEEEKWIKYILMEMEK